MKQKLLLVLSASLQIGGCIAIGYETSWVVGLAVFCVVFGHNIEKHNNCRACSSV